MKAICMFTRKSRWHVNLYSKRGKSHGHFGLKEFGTYDALRPANIPKASTPGMLRKHFQLSCFLGSFSLLGVFDDAADEGESRKKKNPKNLISA